MQTFEEYYLRKHNGRKITLYTQLGSADIKAIFYGGGASASNSDELSQQVRFAVVLILRVVFSDSFSKILKVSRRGLAAISLFQQNAADFLWSF